MLAHGAFGVRYIPLAPVPAIAVSEGMILRGIVGLQLELGKKIGFAATAYSRFRLLLYPPSQKQLSQSLFLFFQRPEGLQQMELLLWPPVSPSLVLLLQFLLL